MRSSHTLDRLATRFDERRLIADAGLLLPATLAARLGLRELFDRHVDLGPAAGRANAGSKALTLIMSALAGGDCIDDADALRAGGSGAVLAHVVAAPSTLGTFLRSFTFGHARQLDRVSRAALARAWAAGAGPGSGPLTIDLDSTICETYGLRKQGGSHFTYTHVRGYHPLLAVAAGTGDVLHARLRGGRANSGRGAAGFLRETVARVREAGAAGPLCARADSGFYGATVVRACPAGPWSTTRGASGAWVMASWCTSALRLRTGAAKRFKKVANATMLIWRVLRVGESRFRRLDAPELLADVYDGRRFADGKSITRTSGKVA